MKRIHSRTVAATAMGSASSQGKAVVEAMSAQETLHALAAGIRAIATSPAFGAAVAHTGVLDNHHWILLLFRLHDGEVITGLGYVDDPYPGVLDRALRREYVESMVEMDLSIEPSTVNAAVREHGGVTLAPELAHLELL